jgi:S1-C subfamily serine protease
MQIEDRTTVQPIRRATLTLLSVASLFASALIASTGDAQAFSAANVYRNTSPSVVLIFGFSKSGAGSSGTGSIITRDGLILTNNHVVTNSDTGRLYPDLVVYFKPNPISGDNRKDLTTPFLVEVIARDPDLDLALLRVKDAPPSLRPVEIADSEEVDVGESVAAIGHPGGGGLWTLTTGTISSKRRDSARDIFQTDAAINPGNSGGPLLDEYSRLVGVNTFVRRVNDQGLPLEGLNYSLRSSLALAWVNQQGVAQIRSVSRSSAATPAPQTSAASTSASPSPAEPTPVLPPGAEPSEPAIPQMESADPTPPTEPDARPDLPPTPAPTAQLDLPPPPAPTAQLDLPPPPPPEPEAREFKGPDGETMYGVPNPTIDLHEALIQVRQEYQELTERADESVNEMNRLMDDYDNF